VSYMPTGRLAFSYLVALGALPVVGTVAAESEEPRYSAHTRQEIVVHQRKPSFVQLSDEGVHTTSIVSPSSSTETGSSPDAGGIDTDRRQARAEQHAGTESAIPPADERPEEINTDNY